MIIPTKNGLSDAYSALPDTRTDWREECLSESLRGHDNAEYDDALVRAVRRFRPDTYSLVLTVDRNLALEYLREHLDDFRPLAALTECYNADTLRPYIGWWQGGLNGEPVEVALTPSWYESDTLLLCGTDADRLRALAIQVSDYAERPRNRSLIYTAGWESAPQLDDEIGKIGWEDVILPPVLVDQIRATVEGWANGKDIYEEMGFAWRRGILLVGPPGTGKTIVGKAVAAQLPDLPFLYVRDLRERNQKDSLDAIFTRARKLAPCILVLEDIDTLITPANRSVLLNELDGYEPNNGLLIIASSNHPEKIDEAFLKRPSRFDRVFHIGLPEGAERATFCRRVLSRSAFAARLAPGFDIEGLIAQIVEKSKGFTPAYLKEALTGAALALAHTGNADVLDERYTAAVLAQVDELKKTIRRLKDPTALAEMTTGGNGIGYRRGLDN